MGKNWMAIEGIVRGNLIILMMLAVFVFAAVKLSVKYRRTVLMLSVPVLIFIKLAEDMIRQHLSVFDGTIYSYISGFITKGLTKFMIIMSYLGSAPVLIAIALLLYVIAAKKGQRRIGNVICLNLASVWVLNDLFKIIFHRERPDILRLAQASGYSFPSGHSMVSAGFYGLLLYLFYKYSKAKWQKVIVALFIPILIIFIGISRIYLGVHYASDVLAGFAAGSAWIIIYIENIKNINFKKEPD